MLQRSQWFLRRGLGNSGFYSVWVLLFCWLQVDNSVLSCLKRCFLPKGPKQSNSSPGTQVYMGFSMFLSRFFDGAFLRFSLSAYFQKRKQWSCRSGGWLVSSSCHEIGRRWKKHIKNNKNLVLLKVIFFVWPFLRAF